MTKSDIVVYFGNRGMDLENRDFKEFGVVGRYVFIHLISAIMKIKVGSKCMN